MEMTNEQPPDINQNPHEVEQDASWPVRLYWLLSDNLKWVILGGVVYAVLGHFGYVPLPTIKRWQVVIVSALLIGRYILGPAVTFLYGDRFVPDGKKLRLDSLHGISDVITIPRGTFAEYDILGSMPLTRSITGDEGWRIRAIDTANKLIIPGGTAPEDDRYPDDYKILAQEGDLSAVEALERALMEDAEEGRKNKVSDEVRMEMALQDVTRHISVAMRDIRDSSQRDIPDEEIDRQARETATQILQQAGNQTPEGDSE